MHAYLFWWRLFGIGEKIACAFEICCRNTTRVVIVCAIHLVRLIQSPRNFIVGVIFTLLCADTKGLDTPFLMDF